MSYLIPSGFYWRWLRGLIKFSWTGTKNIGLKKIFCLGSRKEKLQLHPSRTPKVWEWHDAAENKIKSLVWQSYRSTNLCQKCACNCYYLVHNRLWCQEICLLLFSMEWISFGHLSLSVTPTNHQYCQLAVQFILYSTHKEGKVLLRKHGRREDGIKLQSSCFIRTVLLHTSSVSTDLCGGFNLKLQSKIDEPFKRNLRKKSVACPFGVHIETTPSQHHETDTPACSYQD